MSEGVGGSGGGGLVSFECKSSGSEPMLWITVLHSVPKKDFSLCGLSFSFLFTSVCNIF